MKPTVSLSSTGPQPGNCQRRVRVSSVANRASCDVHVGAGQGVQERALAGVGVADQRDGHLAAAGGHLALAAALDRPQLAAAVR